MGKSKKSSYIDKDLQWVEEIARQLKEYIDVRPFNKLKDRIHAKTGTIIMRIEDQRKDLTAALKEYIAILGDLDQLRAVEEAKKDDVRGDQALGPLESGDI